MADKFLWLLPKSNSLGSTFRHDINGLRALAILLVMGFHFEVAGITGGFIGVDIFFVISGYLMTRIITTGFDTGRFTLVGFYMARVRRIVPALVVLCASVMVFGLFALDPLTLKAVGQEAFAAMTFWSNLLFATQRGYFDTGASSHWLQHTWSLSVEWQFYIFYPVLFIVLSASKASKAQTVIALCILFTLSLLVAEILRTSSTASRWYFFVLPNRAWEMLAGGLVVYLTQVWQPKPLLGQIMHYGGLGVIGLSCLIITPLTPWPSAHTMLPIAGMFLVLASNQIDEEWSRFLPISLIGKWSYSIYLWHWPLVVYAGYYGIKGPWLATALLVLSVSLGVASYELVEKRLTSLIFNRQFGKTSAVGALIPIMGLGAALWMTIGFEDFRANDPAKLRMLRDIRAANGDWAFDQSCRGGEAHEGLVGLCFVGEPSAAHALIIGDSHAQQIAPRYAALLSGSHDNGALFVTNGGCLPVRGVSRLGAYAACSQKTDAAFKFAMKSPIKEVVFVAIWNGYLHPPGRMAEGLNLCFIEDGVCAEESDPTVYQHKIEAVFKGFASDIAALEASGHHVTILDVVPVSASFVLDDYYRDTYFDGVTYPEPIHRAVFEKGIAYARNLIEHSAHDGGADMINPRDSICDGDLCPTYLNGRLLYKDGAHYRSSVVGDKRFGFLDGIVMSKAMGTS